MGRVRRRTALTLPLLGGLAGCLGPSWDELPGTRLVIATGNPGGVFHIYGEALADVLTTRLDGVTATTRPTDASVQNVHLVHDRECDLGLSLGDTAADAVRGRGTFDQPLDVVALARTYDSFVHLVVRADSGLTSVGDLRGRRVGLGSRDSGTRVTASRVLRQSGVSAADFQVASDSLQASAAALRAGTLDAFFFVSGLPNEVIARLATEVRIRLIDLSRLVGPLTTAFGPEYDAGPVPASMYGLTGAVDTVSVKNYLVVHRQMPEELAYAVTRVVFEDQADVARTAPGVRQPNLGAAVFTSPLDLHPGAVRYYRERRP